MSCGKVPEIAYSQKNSRVSEDAFYSEIDHLVFTQEVFF